MAKANATPTEDDLVFSLRHWGHNGKRLTAEKVADELERIAAMIRDGFTSGEALRDEDIAGQGWWNVPVELD